MCEHPSTRQRLLECNFPEYVTFQCKDCKTITKYSGLTITSVMENLPQNQDSVIVISGNKDKE